MNQPSVTLQTTASKDMLGSCLTSENASSLHQNLSLDNYNYLLFRLFLTGHEFRIHLEHLYLLMSIVCQRYTPLPFFQYQLARV